MKFERYVWLSYVLLTLLAVLMVVPLVFMFTTSVKTLGDILSLQFRWVPREFTVENFTRVLQIMPFARYLYNTASIVAMTFLVQSITISLAAYAFARLRFKGRDLLFFLFLVQLMIPATSIIIPNYQTIRTLGILNRRLAVGIVYFASAYGTFLMRQAFRAVPRDLEDTAKIDGCNGPRVIRHVLLPLTKPSLIAFAFVSGTFHWNNFFWPLLVTDTVRARTLTVGLAMLTQATESTPEITITMAAAVMITAPLFMLFIVFQKPFIESFAGAGALKG
ncbi:MAG: carbohydrate ABC transporter permease [Spirochaetaceae bacterium]|nr:MAG: carbohydrate ABC transporter permease [Spirochaetaceae bacterium]